MIGTKYAGEPADRLDAAEDHRRRRRPRCTRPLTQGGMPKEPSSAVGHRVGLHHVADAEGRHRGEQREQPAQALAQPRPADAARQVVHRPAGLLAARVGAAELDRQHRLGELGGHAHQAGHPHPEQRAGTAERDRRRHADDVAGADGRRQRRHQRLEVGDVPLGALLAAHDQPQPERVPQLGELQAAQPDRQEQPGQQQQRNQQKRAPDEAAKALHQCGQCFHQSP